MRKITLVAIAAGVVSVASQLIGAPEKRIDLAALVPNTEAEPTLAESVKDPQQRNGEDRDGYYSRCNYYSEHPGKSLVLRVRQAAAGQLEPAQQLAQLSANNSKIKSLTGLGDKAGLLSKGA